MILDSIIIENIRSYAREEIEFHRGISLFEGEIGSGKSTILMAIEFALFGLGSYGAESLLAKKSESGSVILDFSTDDGKYQIKRTLRRKDGKVTQDSKNSWIKVDGETLPLSSSEMKQKVLQILRFNEPESPKSESRIFRYAVFTPQEAMKDVLFDPKKRLETIQKAFRIEEYSIAKSNAKDLLAVIKEKVTICKERSRDMPALEAEISKSNEKIAESNQEIERQSDLIKAKIKVKEEITAKIKELRAKNNKRIELSAKRNDLEEKIKSEENQIQKTKTEIAEFDAELKQNAEEIERLNQIRRPNTRLSADGMAVEIKKIQEIKNKQSWYNSEKNTLSKDISDLERLLEGKTITDKRNMEARLEHLENGKEKLEKDINQTQEKLKKINAQKTKNQTQNDHIIDEIKNIQDLENVCPTCKQEISKEYHDRLIDERQHRIDDLKDDLGIIEDLLLKADAESDGIQSSMELCQNEILQIQKTLPRIEEHANRSSRLAEIEIEINRIKNLENPEFGEDPIEFLSKLRDELIEFDSAAKQSKIIAETISNTKNKIAQKQNDVRTLETGISKYESEMVEIKAELETFEDLDGEISERESEQERNSQEITDISSQMAASKQTVESEMEKVTQNQEKVSESRKWKKRLRHVSELSEWLEEFFIPTVSEIEKQVLLSILQDFDETYARLYSSLIDDPTKESKIDEDFMPTITQDGYEQKVDFLSGGEKASVALAYRLALNTLIRRESEAINSGLLILDEPTDGFSKSQIEKMMELLVELKSEQIVLVSHEKELETHANNVIHISKRDGTSRITSR